MQELEKLDIDLLKYAGVLDLANDYRRLRSTWSRELCLELVVIIKRIKDIEAEIQSIDENLRRLTKQTQ